MNRHPVQASNRRRTDTCIHCLCNTQPRQSSLAVQISNSVLLAQRCVAIMEFKPIERASGFLVNCRRLAASQALVLMYRTSRAKASSDAYRSQMCICLPWATLGKTADLQRDAFEALPRTLRRCYHCASTIRSQRQEEW
jgi:hypothetical protein